MAFKMFSVGLVLALAGTCLCQQQSSAVGSQYQQQSTLSQPSYQIGSAATPQTKLEDIEFDSLAAAAFGQKAAQQQPAGKSSPAAAAAAPQPQAPQQPQAYQTVPQQQYFVQPYPAQQQQFYVQPYQAQPYPTAFDYSGVQYMFINPNAFNQANQVYQQFYVPAAPQPSAVPQYVTKQPSSSAAAKAQQEYKQQYVAAPAQQEYKQQYVAAPAQQEYKQQQYVVPAPAYQYVQQPSAVAPAAAPAATTGSLDFSYVTRHPATNAAAQFKAPASSAVQPPQQQFQYTAAVAPQQVYQQPQYYYTVPSAAAGQAQEQARVQQSAKSQYSSGVKSTTPTPVKESFAYKFETPAQQQPAGGAYSTLRFSA